jgi:hypothetical protein
MKHKKNGQKIGDRSSRATCQRQNYEMGRPRVGDWIKYMLGSKEKMLPRSGSIRTCRGFRSVTLTTVSSPIMSAWGFLGIGSGRAFLRLTSVDLECCTRAFHLQMTV